jgi:hypothetical protein
MPCLAIWKLVSQLENLCYNTLEWYVFMAYLPDVSAKWDTDRGFVPVLLVLATILFDDLCVVQKDYVYEM